MSQNIEQIYTANPATTMELTDLLYLGRSPFSASDDFAVTWDDMQSSITGTGTITTGVWQGTDVGILYGGTGVSSVTTAPTASAWAGWNASSNLSANNFLASFTSTVTAAGTTTLTVASTSTQEFTGSTTQTLVLPVVSTLALGTKFYVINNSSGAITVNSSGSNLVVTMAANTSAILTNVAITGTGAASWNATYISDSGTGVSPGTVNQLAYYASTGSVVSGLATANTGFLITSASGVPSISNTITTVQDQSTMTVNGIPTLSIANTGNITYPSSSGFAVKLGTFESLVANTSQTINSGTPGGFNFVYGNFHSLSYTDNGTNDLSRLTFQANQLEMNWTSTNTASQVGALTCNTVYNGSDQGGRTTSGVFGIVNSCRLTGSPASSTVTVANSVVLSNTFMSTNASNTGITKTITALNGILNTFTLTSAAASNTTTITTATAYNSAMTLSAAGAGSTLAITNLYGLRLQSPTVGANTTITNRYGVSSEDASAQNVFAGIIIPSQTLGLQGTTTNNSANAGSVGELIETIVLIGSPVSLTTATTANIGSVSLTAGDWDVWAEFWTAPDVTTTSTVIKAGITQTSATMPTVPATNSSLNNLSGCTFAAGVATSIPIAQCRQSLSGTTTVYLVANVTFAISTMGGYGKISARRRR